VENSGRCSSPLQIYTSMTVKELAKQLMSTYTGCQPVTRHEALPCAVSSCAISILESHRAQRQGVDVSAGL
jgi:hypothetical protein